MRKWPCLTRYRAFLQRETGINPAHVLYYTPKSKRNIRAQAIHLLGMTAYPGRQDSLKTASWNMYRKKRYAP